MYCGFITLPARFSDSYIVLVYLRLQVLHSRNIILTKLLEIQAAGSNRTRSILAYFCIIVVSIVLQLN